jgi:hypothetical protein
MVMALSHLAKYLLRISSYPFGVGVGVVLIDLTFA